MKAHRSDILGEWARENGFENIARNHHPQEVERRRQQAIKIVMLKDVSMII